MITIFGLGSEVVGLNAFFVWHVELAVGRFWHSLQNTLNMRAVDTKLLADGRSVFLSQGDDYPKEPFVYNHSCSSDGLG